MGVLLFIFPLRNYTMTLWTLSNAKATYSYFVAWFFWQTTLCSDVDLKWQLVILFSNENNSFLYAARYVDVVFRLLFEWNLFLTL